MNRALLFAAALLGAALLPGGPVPAADAPAAVKVPTGFTATRIASISGARELAVAPNGDLFVGTSSASVYIVPSAEGNAGAPHVFVTLADQRPVAGVFLEGGYLYLGGQFGVFRLPYRNGERDAQGTPEKLASLRTSGVARDHVTTTVAVSKGELYASVGSSCNACDPELDAMRATIQQMTLDGKNVHARAVDIRNAIALAVQPGSGDLWAGVAGRDDLEHGHPYEIFDDVSAHAGTPDYGWLKCYDERRPIGNASCANVVVPRVVFPGYDTPIGAVFYPLDARGRYAFPAEYRGGAFVALHGSWHTPYVAPRVAFVAFHGKEPAKPVNWNDPSAQWSEFVGGCQTAEGSRTCRPTGVAVGPEGSLFVSDDYTGAILRIRPSGR